jgi:arsenite methyltransferase
MTGAPLFAIESSEPTRQRLGAIESARRLLPLVGCVVREMLLRRPSERTPEQDVVMDDKIQVEAYTAAGRDGGVMAPTHLFHTAQACEVIRPGDLVLDLGCGPCTQLAQVAALNPDSHFIGLDLSDEMLAVGGEHVRSLGLHNVELRKGDITDLHPFAAGGVDAVVSSMTLHHLPTGQMLAATFGEVSRVLKPGGGLYLADFARFKSERSMRYFAYQYSDRQQVCFTRDYWNSLHAAFAVQDFRQDMKLLPPEASLFAMVPLPLMQAVKGSVRREPEAVVCGGLKRMERSLSPSQHADFRGLLGSFSLGGLRSSLLRGQSHRASAA